MDWISVGVVLIVGIMGIGSTITAYKLGKAQGALEASMQHIDLIIKRPGQPGEGGAR